MKWMGLIVPVLCDKRTNKSKPSSTRAIRRMTSRVIVLVCPLDAFEVSGGRVGVVGGICGTGCTPTTGGAVCIKGLGSVVGLGGAIFCTASFPGAMTMFCGGSNVVDGDALGTVLDVPVMGPRACAFIWVGSAAIFCAA